MKNTPEMIFDAVSQVIKGQDEYIKTLATLAWLQSVRWNNKNAIGNNKTDGKVNALVIGGSGTGKTATFRRSRVLDGKDAIYQKLSWNYLQ